jgi:hypothetical protein
MKKRFLFILAPILFILPAMANDLSTPDKALKSLEKAYIQKDIETAVAAKDFRYEAVAMLSANKNLQNVGDELFNKAAEVLELSFRKQMETKGFPDFTKVRCSVVSQKLLKPDLVEMVEECVFSDGGKSIDTLYAAKSEVGWRIVNLPLPKAQQDAQVDGPAAGGSTP